MILLDTPVLAALMDAVPDPRLLDWFARHPAAELHISTVTEAELLAAAARLPDGLRQRTIAQIDAMVGEDFAGRVLPLDSAAARDLAAILARAARTGRALPMAVAQNAAIAFESLGLGCCYIGAFRNKPEAMAAELGLPPESFALFGMTVGMPDPERPAAIRPRLPQQAVLHRETYAADAAQDAFIAAYNERLRIFQKAQGMPQQDWTAQAAKRVRDVPALTGREVLRAYLEKSGFKLR